MAKRKWMQTPDGPRLDTSEPRKPVVERKLQTVDEQQADVISNAVRFSVFCKTPGATASTIFDTIAQAAAGAEQAERRKLNPIVYAFDHTGASAIVPQAVWRDALSRACGCLNAGENPAGVILAVRADVSLLGRVGSYR